jgi:hypothetical protein
MQCVGDGHSIVLAVPGSEHGAEEGTGLSAEDYIVSSALLASCLGLQSNDGSIE